MTYASPFFVPSRIVAAALGVCALVGCIAGAPAKPGSIADITGAEQHDLEVEATTEDQARQEVLKAPTEFDVTIEEDRYSWERTNLFLENYADPERAPLRLITKIVGSRWGLATPPVRAGYVYEVWRESIPDGYHYSIQCLDSGEGTKEQAALNAGNFARFVRDGKLEVSLLPSRTTQ
jgi:hypothetical protein